MTVVLKKKSSSKQIASVKLRLIRKQPKKTGIAQYFGALKRGFDGITYQKEIRNEWH
jgi:hypothetical protein